MDRKAVLSLLVLSIRTNLREVQQVLEELNRGAREKTFSHTLERCFRTIEHDARVAGLERFAEVVACAKEVGRRVLERDPAAGRLELLLEASEEFARVANDVEQGVRHRLNESLVRRLRRAAATSS